MTSAESHIIISDDLYTWAVAEWAFSSLSLMQGQVSLLQERVSSDLT